MSEQPQLPNATQFNAFTTKLRDFRGTLPVEEQHMFDAMVHAAFKRDSEPSEEVEGYWWSTRDYTNYPGWYEASVPSLGGTTWANSYRDGFATYA